MTEFVLTPRTYEIFKNFATINPQLSLREGTVQKVCNGVRNFLGNVELDTPIPQNCAIFDLNNLLGVIDVAKTDKLPVIEFGEGSLTVVHEHGSMTIPYAHSAIVAPPPDLNLVVETEFVSFDLPQVLWNKIKKTSSILNANLMNLVFNGEKFSIKLVHEKDKGGTTMGFGSFILPNTVVNPSVGNRVWNININTIQLIAGDYKVAFGDLKSTKTNSKLFGGIFTLNNSPENINYVTVGDMVRS